MQLAPMGNSESRRLGAQQHDDAMERAQSSQHKPCEPEPVVARSNDTFDAHAHAGKVRRMHRTTPIAGRRRSRAVARSSASIGACSENETAQRQETMRILNMVDVESVPERRFANLG